MSNQNLEFSRVERIEKFLRIVKCTHTQIPYPETWADAIENGDNQVTAAYIGRTAVGWVSVRFLGVRPDQAPFAERLQATFPDEQKVIAPLHYVQVHPLFRKQGVAGSLISQAEQSIIGTDKPNIAEVTGLWVEENNQPAINLYKKMEYQEQGTITFDHAPVQNNQSGWQEAEITAIVMTKDLSPLRQE
jgi:ribosomal protein S18 acetylase RimI-like enzyme